MIDLAADHLAEVKAILLRHVPECEVRVFGSRVEGRAKPYSDLDLAIVAPSSLGLMRLAELREAFAESGLPFRVDVLDWQSLPEAFRTVVARRFEPLDFRLESRSPL